MTSDNLPPVGAAARVGVAPDSEPEPIRAGIIGLGRSGWSIHALGMQAHPWFKVAAVADPDDARRSEAIDRLGCAAYADYREMLKDTNVDLVVVASPSHAHGPMSIEALNAGKHVLVEKPMAASTDEADRMIEAAHRAGRILTVYQLRRLDADFKKIQEVIASGVLGPIHEIRMGSYGFQRRRDWQTLQKFAGGQLNNNGAHFVDQALLLAGGEWHDLFVDLRRLACAGDAEDHVKLVFRGKNGVVLDVELGVYTFNLPPWVVMGKYGSLTGTKNELEWQYYDPASLPDIEASEDPAPGRSYGTGETIPWIHESAETPALDNRWLFYDALYESIRKGAPLLVPPEQSRALTALFEACHAASDLYR